MSTYTCTAEPRTGAYLPSFGPVNGVSYDDERAITFHSEAKEKMSSVLTLATRLFSDLTTALQRAAQSSCLPEENEDILQSKNIEALIFLAEMDTAQPSGVEKLPFSEIDKEVLKTAKKTADRTVIGFKYSYIPTIVFGAAAAAASFLALPYLGIALDTLAYTSTTINGINTGLSFGLGVIVTGIWPDTSQTAANKKGDTVNELSARYTNIGNDLRELRTTHPEFAQQLAKKINCNIPKIEKIFKNVGMTFKDPGARSKVDTSDIGRVLSPLKKAVTYAMKEHLSEEEKLEYLSKEQLVQIMLRQDERLIALETRIFGTR